MSIYNPMICRECGRTIAPDISVAPKAPHSIAQCMYRCACGVAYSNAQDPGARTLIWPKPERNVPAQVRAGLADALEGAVNVQNVPVKRWKFSFDTSEDAVTWTVVRGLAAAGQLGALRDDGAARGPGAVLLWGAPVQGGAAAEAVALELANVSTDLGEKPSARTEPDVILAWLDRIVVIEAKYRSRNDLKPGYKGFPRYLDMPGLFAADAAAVTAAGFYELARNWRIGADLAQRLGRKFTLLNLGRKEAAGSAGEFAKLLSQAPERTFGFLTWAELLERAAQQAPLPGWLHDYADKRCLGA